MLMIDCVEFGFLDKIDDVGGLNRDSAAGCEKVFQPFYKVMDHGNMRENVSAEQHVGAAVPSLDEMGCFLVEKVVNGIDSSVNRDLRDVPGRLHAKDPHSQLLEMLEHCAVIARDLYYEGVAWSRPNRSRKLVAR